MDDCYQLSRSQLLMCYLSMLGTISNQLVWRQACGQAWLLLVLLAQTAMMTPGRIMVAGTVMRITPLMTLLRSESAI